MDKIHQIETKFVDQTIIDMWNEQNSDGCTEHNVAIKKDN